jgi:hypothetical protein
MGEMRVVTSALSLARELHRFGEPILASQALALSPEDVAEVGRRIAAMHQSGEAERLWPEGPSAKAYLLASVELLEGAARPCSRTKRLPEKSLPKHLQAAEAERWAAAEPVARVFQETDASRR